MRPQAGFSPHISELGAGPTRVLALHCTLAFGGALGGVAKALGAGVTPSHGQSADWDAVSDFSDTVYAASLEAMARVDPKGGPIDIIGHSFGAATALRIAAKHPDRVRSLMLFEPVFFAVARTDDPDSLSAQETHAAPFFEAMQRGDMAEGARAFNRMWSGSGGWEKLPERAQQAMIRAIHVVPDTHDFLYEDTAGLLAPGLLEAVQAPAILMRGEHALPAIVSTNAGLARRLGNGSEVVLSGAGHMGPISHAAGVAAHIKGLLAKG